MAVDRVRSPTMFFFDHPLHHRTARRAPALCRPRGRISLSKRGMFVPGNLLTREASSAQRVIIGGVLLMEEINQHSSHSAP